MISLNINKLRDGLITQLYIMHSLIFKSYCGMFERCLKITLTLHLFPMDQTMSLINTFQRTASKAYLFISINFFFFDSDKIFNFFDARANTGRTRLTMIEFAIFVQF